MPFKSQAQRRKFAELLVKGEISPETFEEWNRETGDARLPERAVPKTKLKPKRAAKVKAGPKRATKAKPRPRARVKVRSAKAKRSR